MTNNSLAVGDRVQIRDQYRGHPTEFCFTPTYGIEVGDTATVVEVFAEVAGDSSIAVDWDREDARDSRTAWGSGWFDKVETPVIVGEGIEAPGRPLVHFDDEKAGRDRSKAREAAGLAVSRILDAKHNDILQAAEAGESVDAYALNEAVTAAMRSATTRLGQSSGRRAMAKKFAHLAHIVQAVLENHADNLPGYEPGARSRITEEVKGALLEAKREVEHAGTVNQGLTQDLTAARDQREHMAAEARSLREEIDTVRDNLAQTIREANEFEAALAYAKGFLDEETRARVEGFIEGFGVGAQD